MPRAARGGLIEAMRQEALAKSGETDTDLRITKDDIEETSTNVQLDTQAKDALLDSGDPNVRRPVVSSISVNKNVPLYRQALDAGQRPMPGVYLIRLIPYGNVSNCLRKTTNGKRVFFRDVELTGIHAKDGGWRVWTAEDNKFACWAESCRSRMPHIEALYNHIRDGHASIFQHYRLHLETLLYQDAARRTQDVNKLLEGTGLSIDKLVVNRAPNPDAIPNLDLPPAAVDERPVVSEAVPVPLVDDPATIIHEPPPGFRTADQPN